MSIATVSARMSETKKKRGNLILKRRGTNATACINELYDRMIEKDDLLWTVDEKAPKSPTKEEIKEASEFIDSLPTIQLDPKYKNITIKEAKAMRLSGEYGK